MNIHGFDPKRGTFEGWAKKIMTNTAIDYSRSQATSNLLVELPDDHTSLSSLQERPNDHVEEEVLHLIKKLPAVTRQVFSLHVFKGFSHKEIATQLGIAESTSRWHVAEARKNLKEQAHKFC